MASKINADEFVDREGEGKPTLPKGVVLSGVTTITTAVVAENEVANSTGINVGIITSTHFAGNLTGDVNAGIVTVTSQSVIGSAVTISASGIDIGAGVITATSYAGSGANLTGIGATIMTWEYNPDPYVTTNAWSTGIGITFNQKIKAGSGNITLSIANAGVAGTVVENFGIGSSVTITNNSLSLTPTSSLSESQVYYLELPSGVITNMAGDNYVGTAYTFKSLAYDYKLWAWGENEKGMLGQNSTVRYSSPVQIPGAWKTVSRSGEGYATAAIRTDNTMWIWGSGSYGRLGQNTAGPSADRSSPVQIPGTTWSDVSITHKGGMAIKTDGTLWAWGYNQYGQLGQNEVSEWPNYTNSYSSPVQIPGTTWASQDGSLQGASASAAIKTDGTLWTWGDNEKGELGQNNTTEYSSPTQIPGTTWSKISFGNLINMAVKTDGTLWAWGQNYYGQIGQNNRTDYSSPVQIPGTTWNNIYCNSAHESATKTDGTLWAWGQNNYGQLAQNDRTLYSSPVQVPGTTWDIVGGGMDINLVTKTDGTLWVWGVNNDGMLGQNSTVRYSSPVQIPGTDWYGVGSSFESSFAITKST